MPNDQSLPPPPRTLSLTGTVRLLLRRVRSSVFFLAGALFLVVGSALTAAITASLWAALRADPAHHQPSLLASRPATVLIGLFPLIFVGLGCFLLRIGAREVFLPLRLYRTGHAVRGRVTGFEVVTNERINGRSPVRIRYAFQNGPTGQREGSIKTLDGALLDGLPEGTEVTVLYDHQRPELNTLLAALGKVGPRLRDPHAGLERSQR